MVVVGLGLVLSGCGAKKDITDYAKAEHWLNIPSSTVNVDVYSPGSATFGKGVYHTFDYPFYYFNLRQNAENRSDKYLEKK